MTITIEVGGSHSVSLAPERATVHASVSLEGREPLPVFEAVTQSLTLLTRSIEALHDADNGPITWFAVHQISTHTRQDYNDKGEPLPPRHIAAVRVKATFVDFQELGRWLTEAAAIEGFTVDGVEWDLTQEHRSEVAREVRKQALRNAVTQAQDYADALELGPVTVQKISDQDGGYSPRVYAQAKATAFDAGGPTGPDLSPEDIEISASVQATFVVG